MSEIEQTFENGSLNHLLQSFYKCQKIGIRDKFFYEALLDRITAKQHKIVTAKDMTLFGVAVGSNPTFSVDHPQIIKDFYAHCFKHRFLLQADDKTNLNTIFADVNAAKLYAKHLDFF